MSEQGSTLSMMNASSRNISFSMSLVSKRPITTEAFEVASNRSSRKIVIFGSSDAYPRISLRNFFRCERRYFAKTLPNQKFPSDAIRFLMIPNALKNRAISLENDKNRDTPWNMLTFSQVLSHVFDKNQVSFHPQSKRDGIAETSASVTFADRSTETPKRYVSLTKTPSLSPTPVRVATSSVKNFVFT